jgi:hypothetical protein
MQDTGKFSSHLHVSTYLCLTFSAQAQEQGHPRPQPLGEEAGARGERRSVHLGRPDDSLPEEGGHEGVSRD